MAEHLVFGVHAGDLIDSEADVDAVLHEGLIDKGVNGRCFHEDEHLINLMRDAELDDLW